MKNMLNIRIWGLAVALFLPLLSWVSWGQTVAQPSGGTVTQIQTSEGQTENEKKQDSARAHQPAQYFTQAQALDLAKAIQNADAEAGKLAGEKAKETSVTALAQQSEKDHKELGQALENFEKRTKLAPQSSPVKESMTKTWQSRIDHLKSLKKGPEFDKAFIDHEIKFHQEALQLLQTGLKNSAQDPELKKILSRTESEMKTQLQRAQYVQRAYSNEGLKY
jgi:putative membrane protein